jgi:hypothetical protein
MHPSCRSIPLQVVLNSHRDVGRQTYHARARHLDVDLYATCHRHLCREVSPSSPHSCRHSLARIAPRHFHAIASGRHISAGESMRPPDRRASPRPTAQNFWVCTLSPNSSTRTGKKSHVIPRLRSGAFLGVPGASTLGGGCCPVRARGTRPSRRCAPQHRLGAGKSVYRNPPCIPAKRVPVKSVFFSWCESMCFGGAGRWMRGSDCPHPSAHRSQPIMTWLDIPPT